MDMWWCVYVWVCVYTCVPQGMEVKGQLVEAGSPLLPYGSSRSSDLVARAFIHGAISLQPRYCSFSRKSNLQESEGSWAGRGRSQNQKEPSVHPQKLCSWKGPAASHLKASTGRQGIHRGGSRCGQFLVACLPPHWNPGRMQQHLLQGVFLGRQDSLASASYYIPSYGTRKIVSQAFLLLQSLKCDFLFHIKKRVLWWRRG